MVDTLGHIVDKELRSRISEADAKEVMYLTSRVHSVYSRMETLRAMIEKRGLESPQHIATVVLVGLEILRRHCKEDDHSFVEEIAEIIIPAVQEIGDQRLALYVCLLLCSRQYTNFALSVRAMAMEAAEFCVEEVASHERAWLLAFKAMLLTAEGDFEASESTLQLALRTPEIPPAVEAHVLMELATLYRQLGQYTESLDASMKALALVPEKTELAVAIHNNLGATHLQRGNNHVSGRYFEEALRLAQDINFTGGIGTSLLNLGGYYYHIGDNAKALQYFIEARDPLERHGDIAGAAGVLMNIGVIYSQSGDPEQALEHYKRAYELRLKMGQKHLLPEVLVNMGLSYLRIGKSEEAHKVAHEILALASAMGMVKEQAMGHSLRAMAFSREKKYEDAISAYSSSLQKSVDAEYVRGQADALWEMAEVYVHLNKPTNALKLLQEALPVVEQLGETKTLSELHGVLAKTYADLHQYQRAWHHEKVKHETWMEFEKQENSTNLNQLKKQYELSEAQKRAESAEQKKHDLSEAYEKIRLREEQLIVLADDLELANNQLKESNAELEKLNRDKDEFLGIATHELKNPLNTIKLVTSLLAKEAQDIQSEIIEEYAVDIHRTTTRMLKIVQGLLEVNQLELGKIVATFGGHDVVGLVRGLLHVYRDVAGSKNIDLHVEAPQDSLVIETDADLLIQVVDNLVSNAIKFSDYGSSVTISVTSTRGSACISVRDQGPGLTEEDKARLFQKFAKLSARPTAGEHSTGLGLNIARRITEVLGGSIEVESEPESGSDFCILLPMSRSKVSSENESIRV